MATQAWPVLQGEARIGEAWLVAVRWGNAGMERWGVDSSGEARNGINGMAGPARHGWPEAE